MPGSGGNPGALGPGGGEGDGDRGAHEAARQAMDREAADLEAKIAALRAEFASIVERHRLQPLKG